MYSEWKLSEDCEWGPVSFVYYNNIVFRNYFCAICDPMNILEHSEIVTDNFLDNLFNISVQMSQLIYTKTIGLNTWQCCRRCAQDPQPVCSEINNSTGILPGLILEELVNSTVFKNGFLITELCGAELHQCFQTENKTEPGENGMDGNYNTIVPGYQSIKSIGRAVFSVTRNRLEEKTTSVQMWKSSNDSIMFCSNKSVISQLSNQEYKQIQLSVNGLQVGCLLILLPQSLISFL